MSFKESFEIKKADKAPLKKVDELEREKERLIGDLQDSTNNLNELRCVNEKLEDKVKTLTSDLERSNTQLQSFLNGTRKLYNLLRMNKPSGDRQGLDVLRMITMLPVHPRPYLSLPPIDLVTLLILNPRTRIS